MVRQFKSAWLKWERGNKRLDELNAHVGRVLHEQPIAIAFEDKPITMPPGAGLSVVRVTYKVVAVPDFGTETGLLLGETLQSYRASLDHLVWELVPAARRKANPLSIAFPMAPSRKAFWSGVDRRLPGVCKPLRTLIERYQPYRRSPAGRAMRVLQSLSNTDKHRIIIPAATLPASWNLKFKTALHIRSTTRLLKPGTPVKAGTEIVRLLVSGNPGQKYEMDMEGGVVFGAVFRPSVLPPFAEFPSGVPLSWAVETIRETCQQVISAVEQN